MRALRATSEFGQAMGVPNDNLTLHESLEVSFASAQVSPTDSFEENDIGENGVENGEKRWSRRQTFTKRLKKRAASIRTEFSFTKKDKRASEPSSRRGSVPEAVILPLSAFIRSPGLETTSPTGSPPTATSPSIIAGPISSPTTAGFELPIAVSLAAMASYKSASLLDPAVVDRHHQLKGQKARTTKIAHDEEAFIRERMRKKGAEHLFPNYSFVDFIGKGTYGKVYQA